MLGASMKMEIEKRIKNEVKSRVDEIVEQVAKEISKDLVGTLKSWYSLENDKINIALIINKEEIK